MDHRLKEKVFINYASRFEKAQFVAFVTQLETPEKVFAVLVGEKSQLEHFGLLGVFKDLAAAKKEAVNYVSRRYIEHYYFLKYSFVKV